MYAKVSERFQRSELYATLSGPRLFAYCITLKFEAIFPTKCRVRNSPRMMASKLDPCAPFAGCNA